MINDVDDNASGSIGTFYFSNIFLSLSVHTFSLSLADFTEFLKVVEKQKERTAKFDDESDIRTFYFLYDPHTSHMLTLFFRTVDAFVACGGNSDKSGNVHRETLVKIIKHDFSLTIDIEALIDEIDTDGSGEIEYEEFKVLMSG